MKTNKNISAIATMKKKQLIDKEGASLIRALIIISIIGLLAMFTNKAFCSSTIQCTRRFS